MTDYREEMRALILPLDESRRELVLAREQCARSPQLRVRALRAVIQAARTVIRASDLGFARLGPLLPYQLDVLRNPENPNRLPMTIRVDKFEFQTKHFCVSGDCNADGTLTVQTAFNLWQEVICPSLQHLGTPLKPGAGSYDITRYKTNDAGQLLGRDGKPLKEVKEHDPKTGALKTYRREGEPAREIDDLDESDLLEYWRCKAADWSDACNVASILFHKELIDTTSQQLSTEPHANHRDDQQTNDESEVAKKPNSKKSRGRRPATAAEKQVDADMVAEWEKAREAKIYKAEFAREKGMTAKEFDRVLSRVKRRETRSNK